MNYCTYGSIYYIWGLRQFRHDTHQTPIVVDHGNQYEQIYPFISEISLPTHKIHEIMGIYDILWQRAKIYFIPIKPLLWSITVPNMNAFNQFFSEISQHTRAAIVFKKPRLCYKAMRCMYELPSLMWVPHANVNAPLHNRRRVQEDFNTAAQTKRHSPGLRFSQPLWMVSGHFLPKHKLKQGLVC